MSGVGFGNLAIYYQNALNSERMKTDLARLTNELASGRKSDVKAAVSGDLTQLTGIKSTLASLASHQTVAKEAAQFAQATQLALDTVQKSTTTTFSGLLAAGSTGVEPQLTAAAKDAASKFATVVGALNTQNAGRALFAGNNVNGSALAPPATLISDLVTATAAATDAAGIEAAINTWFDTVGGGFETTGYVGSTTDLEAFRIGPELEADVALRADTQTFRDLMKGYAMAAMVAEGALQGNPSERAALLTAAGERLIAANDSLTSERAQLGVSEKVIETELTRNQAEASALEILQSQLVSADPYKTATDIKTAEIQLQSLYALTARLSSLSLVQYLR